MSTAIRLPASAPELAAGGSATGPSPDSRPSDARHAGRATSLGRRLIISAALAVPVIVLSAAPVWQFRYWQWITLALAAPVVVWGAWPFHRAAARLARRGAAGAATLVSLGTLAAFGWSLHALLFGTAGEPGMIQPSHLAGGPSGSSEAIHLDAAAGLTVLFLLAHHLLDRSERRTAAAVRAVLLDAGSQDDQILPAGEAGMALDHPRLTDRVSGVLVPIVIGLAVATLGFWLGAGAGATTACAAAVAVLIVACPCALGLAAPTAWLAGIGRGSRLGILITSPGVLASTFEVDTVVLDKTGIVTTGAMTVHAVHVAEGVDADLALRLAGAVEQADEHPIARAVTAAARAAAGGGLPDVAEFDSTPGFGVRGVVAELEGDTVVAHAVLIGRPELLTEHGIELPADLAAARDRTETDGHTSVAVAWDGVARAVLAIHDPVRPTSAQAVRELAALGLAPMLLTGDNGAAARVLADRLGIPAIAVIPEVPPAGTPAVIERLRADGHVVALVVGNENGTGTSGDAAAPAAADLTLVMGAETPPAGGDLTVVRGDLLALSDAVRLARRTLTVIRGNLLGAVAYTVVALPPAALGLLDPTVAVTAVAFGSALIVTNSVGLWYFRGTNVTQATH